MLFTSIVDRDFTLLLIDVEVRAVHTPLDNGDVRSWGLSAAHNAPVKIVKKGMVHDSLDSCTQISKTERWVGAEETSDNRNRVLRTLESEF